MKRCAALVALAALGVAIVLLVAGCAGTQARGEVPDDPEFIRKEIGELDSDINNAEELIKGYKAELNQKENAELRGQIREMEMQLYELRAQKAALEERLMEIEAEQSS